MSQTYSSTSRRSRQQRLRELMNRRGLGALLLRRSTNFACYTGGADNRVDHASPFGFADVLITLDVEYILPITSRLRGCAPRVKSICIPQQEWTGSTRPLGTSCLPVERGVVRWFDIEAGVGTIASEPSDEEVFFHFTAIPDEGYRTLTPGTVVRFEVVESSAGLTARNVQKEGS